MAHMKTAVDTQAANITKATWAVFPFPSKYASYHVEAAFFEFLEVKGHVCMLLYTSG